jgi:hypothetical protein
MNSSLKEKQFIFSFSILFVIFTQNNKKMESHTMLSVEYFLLRSFIGIAMYVIIVKCINYYNFKRDERTGREEAIIKWQKKNDGNIERYERALKGDIIDWYDFLEDDTSDED